MSFGSIPTLLFLAEGRWVCSFLLLLLLPWFSVFPEVIVFFVFFFFVFFFHELLSFVSFVGLFFFLLLHAFSFWRVIPFFFAEKRVDRSFVEFCQVFCSIFFPLQVFFFFFVFLFSSSSFSSSSSSSSSSPCSAALSSAFEFHHGCETVVDCTNGTGFVNLECSSFE
jgi:hypothetical protein